MIKIAYRVRCEVAVDRGKQLQQVLAMLSSIGRNMGDLNEELTLLGRFPDHKP